MVLIIITFEIFSMFSSDFINMTRSLIYKTTGDVKRRVSVCLDLFISIIKLSSIAWSRWFVGSSNIISGFSDINALINATLVCCPPLNNRIGLSKSCSLILKHFAVVIIFILSHNHLKRYNHLSCHNRLQFAFSKLQPQEILKW